MSGGELRSLIISHDRKRGLVTLARTERIPLFLSRWDDFCLPFLKTLTILVSNKQTTCSTLQVTSSFLGIHVFPLQYFRYATSGSLVISVSFQFQPLKNETLESKWGWIHFRASFDSLSYAVRLKFGCFDLLLIHFVPSARHTKLMKYFLNAIRFVCGFLELILRLFDVNEKEFDRCNAVSL